MIAPGRQESTAGVAVKGTRVRCDGSVLVTIGVRLGVGVLVRLPPGMLGSLGVGVFDGLMISRSVAVRKMMRRRVGVGEQIRHSESVLRCSVALTNSLACDSESVDGTSTKMPSRRKTISRKR